MHLLDPMCVYFAKFVSPGPFDCADPLREINLPTYLSDHFVDAGRSHRLKHISIVADMDVGGVVTNDRSNS